MRTLVVRLGHPALKALSLSLFLLLLAGANSGLDVYAQGTENSARPRYFNIEGRVSLPDGSPAANVRVKIRGGLGVNFETTANDAGRFEFPDVPSGTYQIEARSLTDPTLTSDTVQTNTFSTATNSVVVSFSMHSRGIATRNKPGVISVADAGQKVPKKAREAFERGLQFRSTNKPDLALNNFNQAIELYPNYYQALTARADINLEKLQTTEAAADFEQALKTNPNYGAALRGIGYCKLLKSELQEAATYFDKATIAEPANARSFLLLGMANFEMNKRDEAEKSLLKALEIDPVQSARAHLYLANIYAYQKQYERAAGEVEAYLKRVPTDAEAAKLREMEAQWRAQATKPGAP